MFNKKRTLASLLALGLVTSSVGVTSLADDNGKGQETVVTDNDNLNTGEENSSYQFKETLEMEVQEGEERAEVEFSEDLDKPVWVEIYKDKDIVGKGGYTEESTGYGTALINLREVGAYTLKVKEKDDSEEFLAEIPLTVKGENSSYQFKENLEMEVQEGEERAEVEFSEDLDKPVWVEIYKDKDIVGEGGYTEESTGYGTALINLTEEGAYTLKVKENKDSEEFLAEIPLTVKGENSSYQFKETLEMKVQEGEERAEVEFSEDLDKPVWVEIYKDKDIVGEGGYTEESTGYGTALINLTEEGAYTLKVKENKDSEEFLAEIPLTVKGENPEQDSEEEKLQKEVVKEGETFDLETGFKKPVWVEVQKDGQTVGSGGMTEADGIAKINLTKAGEYKVIVKDEENGEVLKEITLTMTDTKKDLKEKIEEGKNTSTNGKTYNSRKKLKDAIEEAEKVLNDENSELEDMKEAIKAIDDAINGLVNQPSTGGSSGGGSSSSDRDKNKDKDDDDDRRDDRRDRYYDDGGRRYSSSTDEVRYFKDLAGYAWAEPAIKNLSMRNIIKGKTEDRFDPSANIKRGEFAVIVARYLRLDTTNTVVLNNFDDVSRDKYYYTAVNLLANKGIIEGKGARRYDPEAPITRQEIAKIVASLDNKSVGDKTSINKFKDHGKIASWAKEPMAKLVNNNILTGYGDGTVRPQGNAKRAEVAVMIYRLGN